MRPSSVARFPIPQSTHSGPAGVSVAGIGSRLMSVGNRSPGGHMPCLFGQSGLPPKAPVESRGRQGPGGLRQPMCPASEQMQPRDPSSHGDYYKALQEQQQGFPLDRVVERSARPRTRGI